MSTTISAHARLRLAQPGPVLLQLAAHTRPEREVLTVTCAGAVLPLSEVIDARGGRHHLCDHAAGLVDVAYQAVVDHASSVPDLGRIDRLEMLRPSRFCPSDRMSNPPVTRVEDVEGWVHDHLSYVLGSSALGEDALETMERGTGVCRDYAHLVVTICRALDVPARVFSAYAPGLEPQDFHMVAEVWRGDAWQTVDATRLVDTSQLVRICTGRDAADTAWMTSFGPNSALEMVDVQVSTS